MMIVWYNSSMKPSDKRLQQFFGEWTEEDGRLSAEQADRLHAALEQSRGLCLRSPALDKASGM